MQGHVPETSKPSCWTPVCHLKSFQLTSVVGRMERGRWSVGDIGFHLADQTPHQSYLFYGLRVNTSLTMLAHVFLVKTLFVLSEQKLIHSVNTLDGA